ncbi:MAG: sugar phosphate isomerase/epimerase family protein [Planctomycetota bacterium]|jgi:sugar phosphate isomerase/epimerase|nr:sugar phosphate isomerase/epimerase family protein [Planctomycetota bacterium]MDP7251102.1 sugar phosphate isomerase/epimerase family protein [Planctomycetota bacterium]
MNFGIIHYNAPGESLEEFLDYAAETGFNSVELFVGDAWHDGVDSPEAEAERVRALVESKGLSVCAVGSGNDFVLLDENEIQQQVVRMERVCKLTALLGTNVIRTEGGRRKDEVPFEKERDAMAECLKRCREFIERDEIYLGVDNHGHVTNDGELQVRIFEEVDSPFVGATMDTMNYHWMGHDIETCNRFYDLVAPYVFHTHMKDGTGSQREYVGHSLGEGNVDLPHACTALKNANYKGAYCAEWEGRGDKAEGYARCLEWMKANISDD